MTIAATIQAAEIQAAATVKATFYAAIIGAVGIGGGVLASWYTALHLQKVARLAEIRRDVYLEFSESFSILVTDIGLIFLNLDENWNDFVKSAASLNTKMEKVLFVCEVQNKESVYIFDKLLGDKINQFIDEINPLKVLVSKRTTLIEELMKDKNQIDEIVVKIEKKDFGDSEKVTKDYFNELRLKIENKESEINSIGEELITLISSKSPCVKVLIKSLKEGFMPLSHKLRSEIGNKTDIDLDLKIYTKFYNK